MEYQIDEIYSLPWSTLEFEQIAYTAIFGFCRERTCSKWTIESQLEESVKYVQILQ